MMPLRFLAIREPSFTQASNVYVVAWRRKGPCKIGVSLDPAARLEGLQGGNPNRLRIFHAYVLPDEAAALSVEGKILDRFAQHRQCGEWLDLPVVMVRDAVMQVIEGITGTRPCRWKPTAEQLDNRERSLTRDDNRGEQQRTKAALSEDEWHRRELTNRAEPAPIKTAARFTLASLLSRR